MEFAHEDRYPIYFCDKADTIFCSWKYSYREVHHLVKNAVFELVAY